MHGVHRFRGRVAVGLFLLVLVSAATAKYSGGSGTAQDPYQIATAADLIALGQTPADYDKHFILTADLDLDPNLPGRKVFDKAVIAPDADRVKSGYQGTAFTGVLDGNAHVISHLTIKGDHWLWLFGQLGSWATLGSGCNVKNLRVADVNVAGSGNYVGGLVGENYYGALTDCYSTGAVTGRGENGLVGGLVGGNGGGRLTACYSTATVGGQRLVGGLVGHNDEDGRVVHCYSIGAVRGNNLVGGLVGANNGSVTYCYSTGAVRGVSYIGGLVGRERANNNALVENGVVTYSFWDIQTSGQAKSAGGTGKTTVQMQTARTFLDAGWDFVGETENGPNDVWKIVEGQTYPLLSWQKYSGGTGEPNDPYQIATAADLIALGNEPNDYDKHFILTADIDLAPNLPGRKAFDKAVIAPDTDPNDKYGEFRGTPFTGVFDGGRHNVSNLKITGKEHLGLFGYVGDGGEVKNLGVTGAAVTGSGTDIGCLVGVNSGIVRRCYSTGSVAGTGMIPGKAGGLVGYNSGYSGYGYVTECYSAAAVHGGVWVGGVGGLVGQDSYGHVTDSYSTGSVNGSFAYVGGLVGSNLVGHLTRCYSTGSVTGTLSLSVGGLNGRNVEGTVIGCFWDTQTSRWTTSKGGTGRTTAQMQTAKTFLDAGWDFVGETKNGTEDIWWINEGKDYPRLWWEATSNDLRNSMK